MDDMRGQTRLSASFRQRACRAISVPPQEGKRCGSGNFDRPLVIVSTWRSSTMQPSSPVAFLGAFLVGLAALVGVLVSLVGQITQLNLP